MARQVFRTSAHAIAYGREYVKQAVLHYPPLWVTLGICSPCANKCAFCAYHSPDARNVSRVFNVPFLMPLDAACRYIDFFYRGGVPRIHVCATGDPLFHPDFFAVLDHVISRFGAVSFQSNFPASLVEKRHVLSSLRNRRGRISSITVDLMGNTAIKGNDENVFYEILAGISAGGKQDIKGNFLITRINWQDLETVVRSVHAWRLQIPVQVCRVFPHGMNSFTDVHNSWDKRYLKPEEEKGLEEILLLARSLGVRVFPPTSQAENTCDVFWKKLQIWPTRGSAPGRLDNLVPHGCNAVVLGDMATLGYVDNYQDVFALWNNPRLVEIRKNLLAGIFPDRHCTDCPYCPHPGGEGAHDA